VDVRCGMNEFSSERQLCAEAELTTRLSLQSSSSPPLRSVMLQQKYCTSDRILGIVRPLVTKSPAWRAFHTGLDDTSGTVVPHRPLFVKVKGELEFHSGV